MTLRISRFLFFIGVSIFSVFAADDVTEQDIQRMQLFYGQKGRIREDSPIHCAYQLVRELYIDLQDGINRPIEGIAEEITSARDSAVLVKNYQRDQQFLGRAIWLILTRGLGFGGINPYRQANRKEQICGTEAFSGLSRASENKSELENNLRILSTQNPSLQRHFLALLQASQSAEPSTYQLRFSFGLQPGTLDYQTKKVTSFRRESSYSHLTDQNVYDLYQVRTEQHRLVFHDVVYFTRQDLAASIYANIIIDDDDLLRQEFVWRRIPAKKAEVETCQAMTKADCEFLKTELTFNKNFVRYLRLGNIHIVYSGLAAGIYEASRKQPDPGEERGEPTIDQTIRRKNQALVSKLNREADDHYARIEQYMADVCSTHIHTAW